MFKKNNLLRAIVALILLSLTVFSVFFAVAAADSPGYDYSRPSSSHNVTVTSDEILEAYLSSELSETEQAYLERHGKVVLSYDDGITTNKVVTHYESDCMKIIAYEYTYTSVGGTAVSWIPTLVEIGNKTLELVKNGEYFTAEFQNIEEDGNLAALITYTLTVTVSKEDMSALASQSFVDAPIWQDRLAEYEEEYLRLKEKYENDCVLFDEYLIALAEYESKLAVYTDYLSRKKIYDDALEEYNKYIEDLAAYNKAVDDYADYEEAMAEYNLAYETYRAYLKELSDYNAKYQTYLDYEEKISVIRAQLSAIDAARVKMTDGRDVYSAIMGNLVTEVLVGNKDLLTSPAIGAKAEVIETAEKATENLRVLLPYYFSLTTEADRYSYYTVNYEAFKENFTELAKALDNLYRVRRIRGS